MQDELSLEFSLALADAFAFFVDDGSATASNFHPPQQRLPSATTFALLRHRKEHRRQHLHANQQGPASAASSAPILEALDDVITQGIWNLWITTSIRTPDPSKSMDPSCI